VGEDTEQILSDLGYDDDAREALALSGVIGQEGG
jgi:crotonobetainyl-CoA:carnitine CoA-transferase CaiB-like acyl-CoA transferase